ncbi:MAG TPA: hypothetical protein VJU80_16525, partial [Solirubrobacteraceae bacterium]|nr:hypothetical protein [Solirubrobacteraceae bacterium]
MPKLRRHSSLLLVASLVLAAACAESPTSPLANQAAVQGPRFSTSTSAPALLVCPSNHTMSASRVIGPEGGEVTIAGNRVQIPAGAVAQPTTFTLSAPAGRYMQLDISAAGYDHYFFQSPVTVTINYARCGNVNDISSMLSAWYIDS